MEANTKTKYNFVTATDCAENNKTQIAFANACKEIIKLAKLEKRINIWSDSTMQMGTMSIPDVQPEDIKAASTKQKSNRHHSPHQDSTAQGSDTTKMP